MEGEDIKGRREREGRAERERERGGEREREIGAMMTRNNPSSL